MGNRVSLNVGCCRREHLFKFKIDTSGEVEEDSNCGELAKNDAETKKSGIRKKNGKKGVDIAIVNRSHKNTTDCSLKARKKLKEGGLWRQDELADK